MFVGNALKVRAKHFVGALTGDSRLTGSLLQKAATSGVRRMASSSLKAEAQFPSYVLNAPATEVTTLRNGVRVASEVSGLDCGSR